MGGGGGGGGGGGAAHNRCVRKRGASVSHAEPCRCVCMCLAHAYSETPESLHAFACRALVQLRELAAPSLLTHLHAPCKGPRGEESMPR